MKDDFLDWLCCEQYPLLPNLNVSWHKMILADSLLFDNIIRSTTLTSNELPNAQHVGINELFIHLGFATTDATREREGSTMIVVNMSAIKRKAIHDMRIVTRYICYNARDAHVKFNRSFYI